MRGAERPAAEWWEGSRLRDVLTRRYTGETAEFQQRGGAQTKPRNLLEFLSWQKRGRISRRDKISKVIEKAK